MILILNNEEKIFHFIDSIDLKAHFISTYIYIHIPVKNGIFAHAVDVCDIFAVLLKLSITKYIGRYLLPTSCIFLAVCRRLDTSSLN